MNIGKRGNKYITWSFEFVGRNKPYLLAIFVTGSALDIFFLDNTLAIFSLLIFAFAVLLVWAFKIKYYVSFRIMGAFLFFSFLFLLVPNEDVAEKLAIWAYLFLLVGSVQYFAKFRETLRQ